MIWECKVCLYSYDECKGLPKEGIPPGTVWDDLPEGWVCPDCGVNKSKFRSLVT